MDDMLEFNKKDNEVKIMTALYIILGIAAFLLILFVILGAVGYKVALVSNRHKKPETEPIKIWRAGERKKNNAYLLSHNPEDLSLESHGEKMRAWFVPAKSETKKFVICIHGYNCNGPDECGHLFPFYHDEMGFNYLLPDLRGHGRSEGSKIGFGSFDHKDIKLWIDYLVERFGEDIEIVLHGISMGAATAMLVNNTSPREQVKLVVEDCGFTNAYDVVKNKIKTMIGFEPRIMVFFINIFCNILSGYDLKKDCNPLETMKNAKNPVMFVHGGKDPLVPFEMCGELYDACPVDKEIFTVPDAIHAFCYYDKKEQYNEKMRSFFAKHLDLAEKKGETLS